MSDKKIILSFFLILFSIILGGFLGGFNLFGLFDERQGTNLTFLLGAILFAYMSGITVFILDFTKSTRINSIFVLASVFFGFTFFLVSFDIFSSLATSLLFFTFLWYSRHSSLTRARLFVKFLPREIFVPVLKQSFIYLIIIFATLGFFQAQEQLSEKTLVTPGLVRTIFKPTVYILNNQLNSQLQQQLNAQPQQITRASDREKIVRFVLTETVKTLDKEKTQQIFGLTPNQIPIERTKVNPSGEVDLTPVLDSMAGNIAQHLNLELNKYQFIAPVAVALITILLFQPLAWIFNIFGSILVLFVFRLIVAGKFIQIVKKTQEVETIEL